MNTIDELKEEVSTIVTEQLEIVEMYLIDKKLSVRDAQQRSLFKPCRFNKLEGCVWCRMKRYILRKRYR